jgi:hypothetical protein
VRPRAGLTCPPNVTGSLDGDKPTKTVVRAIPNPNQLLLGFSATPYRLKRSESEDLYSMFELAYGRSISDMIREGYLSEVCLRCLAATPNIGCVYRLSLPPVLRLA